MVHQNFIQFELESGFIEDRGYEYFRSAGLIIETCGGLSAAAQFFRQAGECACNGKKKKNARLHVYTLICSWLLLIGANVISTQALAEQSRWHHYRVDTLDLKTDLPVERTKRLLERLVIFRSVIDVYLPAPEPASTLPVEIVVFRSLQQFRRTVGARHIGAFTQPGLNQIMLVVGGRPDEIDTNTLHEYVHYRLRSANLNLPSWYEEGLATLLSQAEFDNHGKHARVGALTSQAVYGSMTHTNFRRFIDVAHPASLNHVDMLAFYAFGTALTHYLVLNAKPINLSLRLSNREDLEQILGIPDTRQIVERAREHFRQNREMRVEHQIPTPGPVSISIDPLTTSEAEFLQASASEIFNPRRAARLYRRYLATHPDSVDGWLGLARAEARPERAREAVDAAIALDPDHPDVLVQNASVHTQECPVDGTLKCREKWRVAVNLYRSALNADPNLFSAIYMLGLAELYSGNAGEALGYLRVAHNRAPWSPRVNFHLGEALRLTGSTQAHEYLERARLWATDAQMRKLAEMALELR